LVPLLQESSNPYWLAAIFELKLGIYAAIEAQKSQESGIKALKPSKMNRLQRSLVHGRVPAVAKDSTVRASNFLTTTVKALDAYLHDHIRAGETWQLQKRALNSILRYWWDTYYLATSSTFEEATFQAHLAIGSDILSLHDPNETDKFVIQAFRRSLSTEFDSGFKLTTGLSMEVLWKQLRPIVVSNLRTMETLAQMEQLAIRFDALRWNVSISVAELGGILSSLVKAYQLILTSDVDGSALVHTLGVELAQLEATVGKVESGITPFLAAEFEALRQFKTLEVMRSGQDSSELVGVDTVVLANYPTTSEMRLGSSSRTSRQLQIIDYLWGAGERLQVISDTFSANMLSRLNGIGEVDLQSLKLLESELSLMGEKLTVSSEALCWNQLLILNRTLSRFVTGVVATHGEDIRIEFEDWVISLRERLNMETIAPTTINQTARENGQALIQSISAPSQLREGFANNFIPATVATAAAKVQPNNRMQYSALAWVHFAVGCIKLYVPDRAFDPDKRQRLERERHERTKQNLKDKLAALQQFERIFTGQDSNLRCQLLEIEIEELGEPAEVLQEIYRPKDSELDQLQGEFGNLLKTVVQSNPHEKLANCFSGENESGLQEVQLLQRNVAQIIRRLSERFRAYNDLTAPVVNMLRCLQIGLSMAALASISPLSTSKTSLALSKMAPFLGAGPYIIEPGVDPAHPIEFLALAATTISIDGMNMLDSSLQQSLLTTFHGCYQQWTKRLESDRLEAESKTGLYRFRGSAEDEDEDNQEQFNELFPEYDEESTRRENGTPSAQSVRDTAIELAKVHSDIFLHGSKPTDSILSLMRQISRKIGNFHNEDTRFDQQNMTASLLPGTLLLLNDEIEALSPTASVPEPYNFYTDANLPETRMLVNLIHQIQARFRKLQEIDEIGHMQPLEDVLVACRELLQFRHTEPLAKIITKVEKIHAFLHEWQFGGWASRANSALTHYDNLTSTIVNWRRLELSTWAKLFDMETKKCEDDARSWWFVAYEVIIATPLQISDSKDEVKVYVQKLLQDLEAYFSTAILGQFVQRLTLLKQLEKHLDLLMITHGSMAIIRTALANFISYYSRYEKPVIENLKKGRAGLEKSMRDVLLLASWKDTNIVALKDSAKRSHHKLFKIVRKFRSILGQPMDIIINQGLPDEPAGDVQESEFRVPIQQPTVDQSALALCATSVPEWSNKNKRFINVSKTVSMMVDASQIPDLAVQGSVYLDSFLTNIITSTAELQKATPSVLTEDNKNTVKHLKSRKRKLFADILKDLRNMGIKYNLGVNALSEQDSLSIVLSNAKNLPLTHGIYSAGLEYYFHKSLDLAPRARGAARQHSQDLSSAEVARSTGFLEGLLQLVLAQRNTLSGAIAGVISLECNLKMIKALWRPGAYDITRMSTESTHEKVLRWLPAILSVALDLIKIHAKLGKLDSQPVQASISSWIETFTELSKSWDALPRLPSSIVSTKQQDVERRTEESLLQLRVEVTDMIGNRPDLGFILNQILLWTEISSCSIPNGADQSTIADLDDKLSVICDGVLVSIEKHKKSMIDLPTSTEDPSWLVKNDAALSQGIKSLHSDIISEQLVFAFGTLRGVDLNDQKISKATGAIFAAALPILQQYFNILQQAIARYAQLHRATCKTSYILAKTFTQIATQGFCTPSEKSDAQDSKTEKLEGGTGLGDGDGVEDISKDIQDDEDLDELAQEPNTGEKGEIEDQEDAVDMADKDIEGELGDAEEKGEDAEGSSGEESSDDMDEEAGDVDDLDPTAVDEKMWDGDGEQAEKDQDGDDSKGKASKDEQVAAQENDKGAPEGDKGDEEDEDAVGAEQGEEIKQDEAERHDPHAQEGEALDLPEDMELDGNEDEESVSGSDDGMNDLSDIEQDGKDEDEMVKDGKEELDVENMDFQEDEEIGSDMDVIDPDEEQQNEGEKKTEEAGEKAESETEEAPPEDQGLLRDRNDEATADAADTVPSEVQGVGEDQDENHDENNTESASKAQREDGGKGGDSSEQSDAAAEKGEKGRQANGDAPQDSRDETQDSSAAQPFKKLGDALERWHKKQTQIREPAETKEQGEDQNMDPNADSSEFQHLQDEDAEADTQAMGTATEEQAHALDESMAVDSNSKEMPDQFQPDEAEQVEINQNDVMDLEEQPSTPQDQDPSDAYEGRAGAMIKQSKDDRDEGMDAPRNQGRENIEEDVEKVDNQLENTHLNALYTLEIHSAAHARQQWTHYEALTRDLSLSLTEQLRLILAPTLATKMRGDFRTGKRLNIKRIIPYIASQYKRDKIWMRRSVPSKRNYQIMLAVDDSKSMGESGSGSLAFETLVMVSKSLSMLEVGEICVVGFGENVKVAHDFETPFSSDAGSKIFQNFGFKQSRTDVTKLVRDSIELFRAARAKASGSPKDLWQMELIISDGVCDSSEHDAIRRLLREALEERIMMVFVIVDDLRSKKKGESVMELKEAKFVKDAATGVSNVKIERYLDTFPFQYYLIVSDVKELPGVLATLLRQWFAEVVDSSN
jgi:midasin